MGRHEPHRRNFIAGTLSAAFAIIPGAAILNRVSVRGAPDEEWLRGLKGKHRQFFDVGTLQGGAPLRRVHNFLATYASAYGLSESEVNAVFGAHGAALPLVLGDTAWLKFDLGAMYGVVDPETQKPAVRNIFVEISSASRGLPEAAGVRRLQSRGVRFLACNNTINSLAEQLAAAKGLVAADVRRELRVAILPSVTVVPAMLIAGNRAQEAGITYAALG